MEKTYGGDLRGEQLEQFLHANSDTIEEIDYFKAHEADEGIELRSQLATESIALNDIEIEKAEANEQFKYLMKPFKDKISGLLSEIRDNGKHVVEKCYKIIFLDENMVGYYNSDGHLVRSRPITSQEKQLNDFSAEAKVSQLKKAD